jgi:hypothetical protein
MPMLGALAAAGSRGFGQFSSSAGELYNFFVSSAPSGISTYSSGVGSFSYAWSATYGLQTAGDAATGFVYCVQPTNSYTGNYLIQASFWKSTVDTCPDPAIGIWNAANGRTYPTWNWGASSTRISCQLNCTAYAVIYGTSSSANGSGFTFTNNTWYTMHVYHEPTLSRTRFSVTTGQNDWTQSGSVLCSQITLADYYSGSYYVGLASDADGYTIGADSTNFSGMKITKL